VGKLAVFVISLTAIVAFLILSNRLAKSLASQERERMEIWANATKHMVEADDNTDIEFLFSIIEQNNSIPVLIADSEGNIIEYRNFHLPTGSNEKRLYADLPEDDQAYLQKVLSDACESKSLSRAATSNNHFIIIDIAGAPQYLYYEDSDLLRRLSWYPYIQMGVMIFLALIIFISIIYTKRAEQNRVWVGLSKETAHQLGTPISSLMAWTQLLESYGIDKEVVKEMDKDVARLSTIADRFSKIGSVPSLEL
jgi:hypothetical protein